MSQAGAAGGVLSDSALDASLGSDPVRFLAAAVALLAALVLAGCGAKPDLDIVAKNCGGKGAGLVFNRDELFVDAHVSSAVLACVLPKVYPDEADRAEVARLLQGPAERTTVGGREIEVGNDDGAPWVLIGK